MSVVPALLKTETTQLSTVYSLWLYRPTLQGYNKYIANSNIGLITQYE